MQSSHRSSRCRNKLEEVTSSVNVKVAFDRMLSLDDLGTDIYVIVVFATD